jgi:hypothetical protein
VSRVPPALARRIDRLARRAHAFHRFGHHPLCEAYAGEVLRAGPRMLLCRGCSFAAAGSVAGVLGALASPLPHPAAFALALPLAAVAARAAVAQSGAAPRRGKLFTRAAPSAMAAALATLGLRAGGPAGVAVATTVLAIAFAAAALYRRRGPDRTPCRACPEREAPRVCSGYRRMTRREAAFARVAGRLLRSSPTAGPPAMPGER